MALLNVVFSNYPSSSCFLKYPTKRNNVVVGKVRLPSLGKASHLIKCVKGGTVTPVTPVDDENVKRSDFPIDFMFGAGTSAYQTEGAYKEDGKGLSVWDTFAHEHPEKINGGDTGDIAVDSYHRYKDNVFVTVVASIQYCALAEKAADAFYKLSNTKAQIQSYVFDVIRACVPKLDLDSTFEQKNDIAKAVEEELEKAMSGYGYEIVQTLIVDIEPDERVKRAMNEINAAILSFLYKNVTRAQHRKSHHWAPQSLEESLTSILPPLSPEDIQLLKKMGVRTYRFSIAWTRILPKGSLDGGINQSGIDHYNDVINELIANGIEPFVTLFHFDSPQYLQDKYGGFLSSNIVTDFKDYCNICFKHFGDRVKHWTTVNEPSIIAQFGYDVGAAAPGRCTPSKGCAAGDSATEPYIVSHNLILAHAAAARLYKDKYQAIQGGEIGMSLVGQWFLPYSQNSIEDREAARRALDFLMGWYLGPLVYGEYPSTMKDLVKDRLPSFTDEEKEMVKGSADFIGINYYTSRYAQGLSITNEAPTSYSDDSFVNLTTENIKGVSIGPVADGSSIIYIYPQGLKDLLVYLKEKYQDPTLYVTENGVTRSRQNSLQVSIGREDSFRIKFIRQHLYRIKEALKEGVNVKGYFIWSLMDSFEFGDGYAVRFGLNFTDYDNDLNRYPKISAEWLGSFLKQR